MLCCSCPVNRKEGPRASHLRKKTEELLSEAAGIASAHLVLAAPPFPRLGHAQAVRDKRDEREKGRQIVTVPLTLGSFSRL